MGKNRKHIKITENPLAGGGFINWIRLLRENNRPKSKYILRVLYVTVMTILFLPCRVLQNLIYRQKINAAKIEKDPVFMLGHFRSGGTHLMNLMTRDDQWGFISTTQAILPGMFLMGRTIRNIFNLFLHEKRPMDNVMVTPESPEEPEHAICNSIPYGFYHGLCFPDRMMDYFRNSVLFENGPSGKIHRCWEKTYLKILKACTFSNAGKQLLIKNPPDTARIPHILKIFPDAMFIFLYRNPYVMFPSIKKFYRVYIDDWQLRDICDEDLEDNILQIYRQIMDRYQQDKQLIPGEHLLEVRFEDLEDHPLEELKRIYGHLGLEGFEDSVDNFKDYIDTQRDYQKNRYSLTKQQIERISQEWSEDINRWGYTPEEAVRVREEKG